MIFDTNALSAFVDGDGAIGIVLRHQKRVAIPVIVLGEYRYGIARSAHRRDYENWLKGNLGLFEVLNITEATTPFYATVRGVLKDVGRPIPANDAWIAALAMEHALPILSLDRHFDAVAGIRRVSWRRETASDT